MRRAAGSAVSAMTMLAFLFLLMPSGGTADSANFDTALASTNNEINGILMQFQEGGGAVGTGALQSMSVTSIPYNPPPRFRLEAQMQPKAETALLHSKLFAASPTVVKPPVVEPVASKPLISLGKSPWQKMKPSLRSAERHTGISAVAVAPVMHSPLAAAAPPSMISSGPAVVAKVRSEVSTPLSDFASADTMQSQVRMLQEKTQVGQNLQEQLKAAIQERDQHLNHATKIVQKELKVLEQATREKDQQTAQAKGLQASVESLRAQVASAEKKLLAAQSQTMTEIAKTRSSKSSADAASRELQEAQHRAKVADSQLAYAKMQGEAVHENSAARIARLQRVIKSMRSEFEGEHTVMTKWQSNATQLARELASVQQNMGTAIASKQTADINVSQIIRKWKETLAQLRSQVGVNSQLEQQIKAASAGSTRQLQALEQQVKARDAQITDLQEQVDESTMQLSQMQTYTGGWVDSDGTRHA